MNTNGNGNAVPAGNEPVGNASLNFRERLGAAKPGESFAWPDNKGIFGVAGRMGVKIKTRKLNGTGYQIWRIG